MCVGIVITTTLDRNEAENGLRNGKHVREPLTSRSRLSLPVHGPLELGAEQGYLFPQDMDASHVRTAMVVE